MSIGNIIFMVIVLGIVWGGFAYCLVLLSKQTDEDTE